MISKFAFSKFALNSSVLHLDRPFFAHQNLTGVLIGGLFVSKRQATLLKCAIMSLVIFNYIL
jgi:hypothetical protein